MKIRKYLIPFKQEIRSKKLLSKPIMVSLTVLTTRFQNIIHRKHREKQPQEQQLKRQQPQMLVKQMEEIHTRIMKMFLILQIIVKHILYHLPVVVIAGRFPDLQPFHQPLERTEEATDMVPSIFPAPELWVQLL